MKPFRAFLYIFSILIGFGVVFYFLFEERFSPSIQLKPEEKIDSLKGKISVEDTLGINVIRIVSEKDITEKGFQYLSGDTTILDSFFQKLEKLSAYNLPVRILYFGDSQIEGDRITSTLRKNFQKKFGGAGIGLVAADLLYNITHSFTIEQSDSWKHVSVFDDVEKFPIHSLLFKEAFLEPGKNGWVKIKQIRSKENNADYSQLKMYYSANNKFEVTVKQGGTFIYKGQIAGTDKIKALSFNFNHTPASIELYFHSSDTLEIIGFSLEKEKGIQVDNIALRGLSFPPFSKTDKQAIDETLRLMNPGMCVLHFGVNLAPYYRDEYMYYRRQLVKEIRTLQQSMPGVPILIVGISDMAKKNGGAMISYPNIERIKKEQIEAARICNCVFWDLEEFMGGSGSMIEWVNADPRLGQKDFVHFTYKGTVKIGNCLSDLILEEYGKYINTRSER